MSDKRIAIIIVTFNASKYLEELFSSLQNLNYPKDKFEIVIIDNASTDNTIEIIESYRSASSAGGLKAKSYKLKENTGFVGGNNVGLQYALDNNFDYAFMLNQDTVVEPGFLQEAVKVAEGDKRVGAVQSLLLLYDKKDTINSIGNHIHYLGFAYAGGYGKLVTSYHLPVTSCEITYPSGAGVLLRCETLKKIGLLCPDLFMYHEDVDLGWRMWMSGYRVLLAPKSIVFHKYEFSRSIKKYYYMERNRYIVMMQNYKIATMLLIFPAMCAMDVCMLVYSFFSGFFREELFAWLYFFKCRNWEKILKNRKAVQGLRTEKDREIIKRFVGKIDFQDIRNPLVKYIFNPIFSLYWIIVRKIIFW